MTATDGRIRRILIAVDGSAGAHRALEEGARLATALGATVGVVSVAHERVIGARDDPRGDVAVHAGQLHEAVDRLAELGLEASSYEPTGDAGPAIIEVADAYGYDTIVLGSRDLGAVRRAILGSVSTYVATHATATVIIAR